MKTYSLACEIAILGGGPAGLASAITAAREGKDVILVEKNGFLGGNLTIGIPPLGMLDEHYQRCVDGFAQELLDRLQAKGACYGTRYCPKHNSVSNLDAEMVKIEAIHMCEEAGVKVLLHLQTIEVAVAGRRISSVKAYGKGNLVTITSELFIDCTGDGDVAYLAGCSYESGRDGSGELMPPTVMCTLEGVDLKKLYDYIEEHPEEMYYSGNTGVQTPDDYMAPFFKADPNHIFVGMTKTFERLHAEGILPVSRKSMIIINGLHPGEVYCNTTRIVDIDATDILSLSKAELQGYKQTEKLVEVLRKYIPGFEKCWVSSIAPNLGVRETRRIKGIKTLTYEQVQSGELAEDTICLSGYKIDIHHNSTTTLFAPVGRPFGVPYGALVSAEVDNLLIAGRSISVDSYVIGSTRVMSTCMGVGQAAGLAAVMAIDDQVDPKDVDIRRLQDKLVGQGAILTPQED